MVRMFHFINLTSDGYLYVTVSLWLQNQIYMLVKQQRQGEIQVKLKVATLSMTYSHCCNGNLNQKQRDL